MADFVQYKDDFPIIKEVPIANKSQVNEAWGQTLDNLSKGLFQQASAMKKEQRDAMFMQSSNYVSEVVTNARTQLIANPNNGKSILDNTKYTIDTILQTTDPRDREQLKGVVNSHLGTLELEAARADRQQTIIKTQDSLFGMLPQYIEDLKNENNEELFNQKSKILVDTLNNAAMSGAITGNHLANLHRLVNDIHSRHLDIVKSAKNNNATPEQLHAIFGMSFTNNSTQNTNLPGDQSTSMAYDYYDNELTMRTALGDADKGIFPNVKNLVNLSEHEYNKVKFRYLGANAARGLVNSGRPYPQVQARLNELSSQSKDLNEKELGELNYLKNRDTLLNNGLYLQVLGDSPQGGKIVQDYLAQQAAIKSTVYASGGLSANIDAENEQDRNAKLNSNLNDFINKAKSYAIASNTPTHLVNVVPPDLSNIAKSGMLPGGNPDATLNTMYSLDRGNQYWLSKSMGNPIQREAVYGAALIRNGMPQDNITPFQRTLIEAAQPMQGGKDAIRKNYSLLKLGESGESESKIRFAVATEMRDVLNHVEILPEGNERPGKIRVEALSNLAVNWVKDEAIRHGDYELRHYQDYAKDFARNYKQGYSLLDGFHYQFNTNELQLTKQQADVLSYYMLDDTYQKLISRNKTSDVHAAIDLSPMNVTNTRDGKIVVMDANGQVIHEEQYTESLLAHAQETFNKNKKEIEKQFINKKGENISEESSNKFHLIGGMP